MVTQKTGKDASSSGCQLPRAITRAFEHELHAWRGLNVSAHHPHFIILFIQIVEHKIAQRDDPPQLRAIANRQMTETMTLHQAHTSLQIIVWPHPEWLWSHNLFHSRETRIAPINYNTFHEVPFGENTHQHTIAQDRDCPDVA